MMTVARAALALGVLVALAVAAAADPVIRFVVLVGPIGTLVLLAVSTPVSYKGHYL